MKVQYDVSNMQGLNRGLAGLHTSNANTTAGARLHIHEDKVSEAGGTGISVKWNTDSANRN